MADETRHAEVCFAFASAYAGAPVGRGPLDIEHALSSLDARTILVTAIFEGCVGETVAALQAIAEEEARHAETGAPRSGGAVRGGGAGRGAAREREQGRRRERDGLTGSLRTRLLVSAAGHSRCGPQASS